MKDPVRLLEGDGSDAERALLRAGVSEEPPADGPRRLAAALGVSIAPLSTPPAATAGAEAGSGAQASTTTAGAASTAPAPLAASFASRLGLKWLALASAGATVAVAVLAIRSAGAPQPQPAHGTSPSERVPPEPARSQADDRVATPAPDPAAAESSGRPGAGHAGSKSIAREIEQLDLARGRLQRGHARAALDELDAYRREHPQGVLAQEAALLRIEALAEAGERGAARRHAERFLSDHPESPHASRIRALLGKDDAR
jgi:Outer membrane lipoprotein